MSTLRRWMILVGLCGALLLPQSAAAAPVTNVQPPAGPAGTQFLFFASGLAANERVGIWLNAPDGRILAASAPELRRTTAYGDATWTWMAPADAPSGVWRMVIYGQTSTVTLVIPFTIGQPAPPANATQPFNITPAHGVPGTLFRFFAAGLEPREIVDISVSGPNGPLKSPALTTPGKAGPDGRIDAGWASPADATPGAWLINVLGTHSTRALTIPVTIDPAAASPSAQLSVQPASGAPGTRFVFSATGLRADEEISIWLNVPDGRVLVAEIEGNAQAAPDGRAGWHWIAPADAPLGTWQMVAHGRDSGIEVVASFTLQ
jgi:hypothetical protein